MDEAIKHARSMVLKLIYSHKVITQKDLLELVENLYPDLYPFTPRILSELVQENSIRRYEFTSDNNRRDEFYLPYEYRIIL